MKKSCKKINNIFISHSILCNAIEYNRPFFKKIAPIMGYTENFEDFMARDPRVLAFLAIGYNLPNTIEYLMTNIELLNRPDQLFIQEQDSSSSIMGEKRGNIVNYTNFLIDALCRGNFETIDNIIKFDERSLTEKRSTGFNALEEFLKRRCGFCSTQEYISIAKYLITNWSNLCFNSPIDKTRLLAISVDSKYDFYQDLIKFLLDNGADPNIAVKIEDKEPFTPIEILAAKPNSNVKNACILVTKTQTPILKNALKISINHNKTLVPIIEEELKTRTE